jgi:prepilin-type N-terminal cleavage/methylation domain-containing protein
MHHSRRRSSPSLRRCEDEGGFTFPELIIASAVTLIIAAAAMALIGVSFRQNESQYNRVEALDEARNGLMSMAAEIRSAVALESVSSQILDVLVAAPEDTANPYHWVRYKCVGNAPSSGGLGGTCSRQDKTLHSGADCSSTGTGPGCVVILRRVTREDTDSFDEPCENYDSTTTEEKHFCVKQNRTVQLSVFVSVDGAENPIELRSAVTIRNCLTNQGQVIPCPTTTA